MTHNRVPQQAAVRTIAVDKGPGRLRLHGDCQSARQAPTLRHATGRGDGTIGALASKMNQQRGKQYGSSQAAGT
jgi:hypothetical protein